MEETSKNDIESCDRISDLPENVIHHILSFLLIKDVIRTSFLSKRWRYIWTSVPNLEFDGLVFSPKTKFMNFVDSVILRRSGLSIQKFSLRFGGYYCDGSRIRTWILAAATHNVRELSISSHTGEPFELPSCIFTCSSLTVLKLNSYNSTLNLPSSVRLPFLKSIQLTSVTFLEDNWNQIFRNCPMLEDVVMEDCDLGNLTVLHISSPSMQRLTIDGLPKDSTFYYPLLNHEIRISTPGLLSLKYTDCTMKNIYLENMSSLVDATIDFKFYLDKRVEICLCHVINFLKGISHTKILTLSSSSVQFLSAASNLLRQLPTFSSLIHLKLAAAVSKDSFRVVTFLLHGSPKLEFLSIDFFLRRQWIDEEESLEPENAASECRVDHLRVVKIKGFGGNENELLLVKYLLENARVLESMIIVFSKQFSANSKLQMEIRQDILMHPRGSTSSEVICESFCL
ncbi:F-box domain [Macleaya cordata]|uniref:F-box domain n=1 Tax=Macleaya cordata TaxID=56857 RepID=A0A200QKR6_MACCD|nr:F-box domain [Macleaya cordata]